ncbi:MAG TPA: xanthine dehydrogenase family protein subunit M [Nitrososphaerales archaeon]|nr:xanthine dehydrogenase family protein subunit M [Nitrososphaerales archaeon]
MYPKKFDYFLPGSLNEAIKLLHDKKDSKVLAGGQSLLALMKLRLAAPAVLVDITQVKDELAYIRKEKAHLAVGAMTPHDQLEHNKDVGKLFPILVDAASKIGDQQIRNRGTVGGSCCHADPAADLPTALLALDPKFVVRGPRGQRSIPSSDFFVDTFSTAVKKDEILTEIRIPYFPKRSGSAYIKHSRREGDFAIVGVGVALMVDPKNICRDIHISLAAVAPTPIRAKSAEKYLKGKKLTEETIAAGADKANAEADPPSDMHGSREYRLEMIKVFTKRAVKLALSRV